MTTAGERHRAKRKERAKERREAARAAASVVVEDAEVPVGRLEIARTFANRKVKRRSRQQPRHRLAIVRGIYT